MPVAADTSRAMPLSLPRHQPLTGLRGRPLLLQPGIIAGRWRHGRRRGMGRRPAQHHHDRSYRETSFHIVRPGRCTV